MATVAQVFALALQHQQTGDLRQAEHLCRQILLATPNHASTHYLLGLIAYQVSRFDVAEMSLRRAVELNSAVPMFHCNLGLARQALGKLTEAVLSYKEALRLAPDYSDAHNALGYALQCQGNLPEAIVHFSEALRYNPDFVEAHNNLGNVFFQQEKLDEAVLQLRHALRLKPDYAEAHNNLGMALAGKGAVSEAIEQYHQALRINPNFAETYNNLGNALLESKKPEEAVLQFQHALRLNPLYAKAYYNLGIALERLDKFDEAVHCYYESLKLDPQSPEAYCNLGVALERQNKIDEAIRCYRQALVLKPNYVEVCNNLGLALERQDKPEEAMLCYRQALAIEPQCVMATTNMGNVHWSQTRFDQAMACYEQALAWDAESSETHFNRSRLRLLQGDWEQGWLEYEWRWKTKECPGYSFAEPRWEGAPMPSGTVLLLAEQGLGDTLHFIRYAPLVKERVGQVMVECQPALVPLLAGASGIDLFVPRGCTLPPFDAYASLLSLPTIFRTSQRNVPNTVPYLHGDTAKMDYWHSQLKGVHGFKIGISWQGNPFFIGDQRRSFPLAQFAPIATMPWVQLISLQKGAGTEQIAELAGKIRVLDLASRLDEASGAFVDTAAVMANLDLVISSDTAIVHLAGALGVPVWVALAYVPDWRWMLERDDSPWYPTMRLFRQKRAGCWEDVFDAMARDLVLLRT